MGKNDNGVRERLQHYIANKKTNAKTDTKITKPNKEIGSQLWERKLKEIVEPARKLSTAAPLQDNSQSLPTGKNEILEGALWSYLGNLIEAGKLPTAEQFKELSCIQLQPADLRRRIEVECQLASELEEFVSQILILEAHLNNLSSKTGNGSHFHSISPDSMSSLTA